MREQTQLTLSRLDPHRNDGVASKMKYTTATVLAALAGCAMADDWNEWSSIDSPLVQPTDPSCKIVTLTSTGDYVWVPTVESVWNDWTTTAATEPVVSARPPPASWVEWSASSNDPLAVSSTFSWVDWAPSSSTAEPSTTPEVLSTLNWHDWPSNSVQASSSTPPSNWGEWSASSKDPHAKSSTTPEVSSTLSSHAWPSNSVQASSSTPPSSWGEWTVSTKDPNTQSSKTPEVSSTSSSHDWPSSIASVSSKSIHFSWLNIDFSSCLNYFRYRDAF
ncbi:hypothetical protein DV736_g6576, partial [Chaetothyriales sp. CBS 134916]